MNAPEGFLAGEVPSAKIAKTPLLQVIDSYRRYYAAGNGHTARAKRLDLDRFIEFLTEFHACGLPEKLKVSHWDFSSVERFVDALLSRGEAPATVARRLATIKHMGRTLAEKVPGFINPAREVKAPVVQTLRPKALDDGEIHKVRRRAQDRLKEKKSFTRMRNEMLFNLLIDTGLRADEVRLLKLGQIDEDLEWIENVKTKGRRFRNVYINSDLREPLSEYLKVREEVLKKHYAKLSKKQNKSIPLFLSTYNSNIEKPDSFLMGAKSVWRAVNELSAGTALHPHLLRHSFAMELLDHSNDVRLVAQALGHSDVRTTMRYTERRDEEIAAAIESGQRRKRKKKKTKAKKAASNDS